MLYSNFYRNQLTSSQARRFYDEIISQIERGNTRGEYKLFIMNKENASDDAFAAIQMVMADCPQYFFLGRHSRMIICGNQLVLYNSVLYPSEETERIKKLIKEKVDSIYQCTLGDDVITRERKVYSYIVRNTIYNREEDETNHNIIGPLLNAKGVCDGYAKVLCIALRKVGIPAIIITGLGRNRRHCWNIAIINNRAYHLDATWEIKDREEMRIGSRYFNLSDKEIAKDHIILTKGVPRCNSVFVR